MAIKTQMTSRERVLAALFHRQTDKVPRSLGFGVNLPAKEALRKHLKFSTIEDVDRYLLQFTDLRWIEPRYIGPVKVGKDSDGIITDYWGVQRKEVSYGTGFYEEICYNPLKDVEDIKELDDYIWPSADWFDFDGLQEQINKHNSDGEYAIVIGNGNIFESSWYMRGFEQSFMDLMTEPELANEIMTRVTNFFISYFERALQATKGKIDIVLTADDIGQQNGLLMSLQLWEEMIKPHHARMNKVLHDYGVKILYHTDGSVMEALPGLIDMGIDILEAIQFDAKGMDPMKMKELHGEKLCFHGGVSVQSTLPFGTKEEVEAEVLARIEVLGKNGGYILAPSHAIQAETPIENILAFLNTGN